MSYALYRCAACLFRVDSFEALRLHYVVVHFRAAPEENDPRAYDPEAVAAWYLGQDWSDELPTADAKLNLTLALREKWAKRPEGDR